MSPTSPRAAWRSVQTTLLDIAPAFTSKRVLARYLSTILCCIVVVVRPFSRLGGKYAFLVLVLKELVFSVQASLAQQLELTVLNILGAVFIALRKDIIWTVGAMWISMSIWRAPPKAAPVSVSQGPRTQFKCLQLELMKLRR